MVYVRRIIEISFVAIAARTYTTATTVGYIMSWKFPTSFPVLVFVVLLPKADVLAESVVADDADDEEKEEEEETQASEYIGVFQNCCKSADIRFKDALIDNPVWLSVIFSLSKAFSFVWLSVKIICGFPSATLAEVVTGMVIFIPMKNISLAIGYDKNKLQFMYIIVVVPREMYIFCDSSSRPNLWCLS